MHDVRPLAAAELVAGRRRAAARRRPVAAEARPRPARATSSITPSTPTTGVGRIAAVAGLVVEADVAAGDRDAELARSRRRARARPAANCHITCRVLRRAEVQAVGDGQRRGAGGRDVAVGLGQRELGAGVGVERDEAARCSRWPPRRRGRSASSTRTTPASAGCGEHGVAADVAVVLVGDPGAAAQVRAARPCAGSSRAARRRGRPRQRVGGVGDCSASCGVRAGDRAAVHRAVVGDGARRHVDARSRRAR